MVQEARRIMLTPDELIAAFECYRRMTPNFLPAGEITDCVPEGNTIRVTIKPLATKDANMDYIIKDQDAVKPLIRFCVENNIMIPRGGQKSLYVKDGFASLYIFYTLDLEIPRYANSSPNQQSPMLSDVLKASAALT